MIQNNEVVINSVRFIVLVLVQVLLLNHVNLFGYVNPYIYPLFILAFPLNGNKTLLIFLGFILGLSIDFFENSGGVHAGATTAIAWMRPVFLKYSFGVSYEHNNLKIGQAPLVKQIVYVLSMLAVHHFILFGLEIFSLDQLSLILRSTVLSALFSTVLCCCIIVLFSRTNR